jgi:hypothetical protein
MEQSDGEGEERWRSDGEAEREFFRKVRESVSERRS